MSKPLDSGKTFFNISVTTDQTGLGFEADTPEKYAHANLTSINGNHFKEILPGLTIFSMVPAIVVVVFKSRDFPPCISVYDVLRGKFHFSTDTILTFITDN